MNERDVERRLREVVDGPQPSAPKSLYRFLREMPEAQAERRGWLHLLTEALPRESRDRPRRGLWPTGSAWPSEWRWPFS